MASADVQTRQVRKALAEQSEGAVIKPIAERQIEGSEGWHPGNEVERGCLECLCPLERQSFEVGGARTVGTPRHNECAKGLRDTASFALIAEF